MVILLKILATLILLARVFFVIFDLAHAFVIYKNTKYFAEKLTEKSNGYVDSVQLEEETDRIVVRRTVETMILYIIVIVISIL